MAAGAPLMVTLVPDAPEPKESVKALDLGLEIGLKRAWACLVPDEARRRVALAAGAPAERTRIVPLGIEVEAILGKPRAEDRPGLAIALAGDVVPEQDVATFVRAARVLIQRIDLVDLYIFGATDRDPAYYRYCARLAHTLGISRLVRFAGAVDLEDIYPVLDCLVIAGAGDAMPLAAVAAPVAGCPVVAPSVSGAREAIEGRLPEDRALGPSGQLFAFGDAGSLAMAVLACVSQPERQRAFIASGRERARRFHDRQALLGEYADLYEDLGG
jgi:glycosyltransferase involved in cell wall biosynthesis